MHAPSPMRPPQDLRAMVIPAEEIGQQPGNFKKNFRMASLQPTAPPHFRSAAAFHAAALLQG